LQEHYPLHKLRIVLAIILKILPIVDYQNRSRDKKCYEWEAKKKRASEFFMKYEHEKEKSIHFIEFIDSICYLL